MPVAFNVTPGPGMLRAINLHDQLRGKAHEISNETVQRHLPLELQAIQLLVAKGLPEHVFGLGRIAAHGACKLAMGRRDRLAHGQEIPSLANSKG